MPRDSQQRPWNMRGILARLYPKRQNISPAAQRQMLATQLMERQLTEMALARFTWKGLPDTADALYVERLLLEHGAALVGVDPDNGATLALQCTPLGPANYQNEYAVFRGIGTNYPTKNYRMKRNHIIVNGEVIVNDPNAVVIYNNATRSNDLALIQYYADRLAELDTTIDINSMNARRNKVVYADSDTELAVSNILAEIASGEPVIKARRSLEGVVTTLDLSVHPDMIDRLHIFRGRMFNEAMMALGIDNTNQDKKERMVTDEIGGNDDQVARIRSAALNQRRKAARQLTALLGRTVTVDYNVEDDPSHDPMPENDTDEGTGDAIHDASA